MFELLLVYATAFAVRREQLLGHAANVILKEHAHGGRRALTLVGAQHVRSIFGIFS